MWFWKYPTPESTGKTESFPFISTMKKKNELEVYTDITVAHF